MTTKEESAPNGLTIQTKYGFGDVVYVPRTEYASTRTPCVECDGKGTPKVEGKDVSLVCPTCVGPWDEVRGWIERREWVATSERLTVGHVRVELNPEWAQGEHPDKRQYMCRETGIGSGTLWSEDRMFLTRDEAVAAAEVELVEREREIAERNAMAAAHRAKRPRKAKVAS
jgi:hypothetical protein